MMQSSALIPTISTLTVALIGIIGAIFVFWYRLQREKIKTSSEIVKIHIIIFLSIIILGFIIILITVSSLYYSENEIIVSLSFNLLQTNMVASPSFDFASMYSLDIICFATSSFGRFFAASLP